MKTITAIEMRHLTNEIIATSSLSDYNKSKSPMASEIMYLQAAKEIMEAALDGKHETEFAFNDEFDTVIYDVINQLREQGYKVDNPNYSNYIEIKW